MCWYITKHASKMHILVLLKLQVTSIDKGNNVAIQDEHGKDEYQTLGMATIGQTLRNRILLVFVDSPVNGLIKSIN